MERPATTIHDPISIYNGDTWELDFLCQNPDGTPMDISDASVNIEWKLDTMDGVTTLFTKTKDDMSITVTTDEARCLVILSAAESATLVVGEYRDQLRVTAGAIKSVISAGRIDVIAAI